LRLLENPYFLIATREMSVFVKFPAATEEVTTAWLFWARPSSLPAKEYFSFPLRMIEFLSNVGAFWGAVLWKQDSVGRMTRTICHIMYGERAAVLCRLKRHYDRQAAFWDVRPLLIMPPEGQINLVRCERCKGSGTNTVDVEVNPRAWYEEDAAGAPNETTQKTIVCSLCEGRGCFEYVPKPQPVAFPTHTVVRRRVS